MIDPTAVKEILGRHMLADGMDIIVDLKKSKGCWLVDQRNGTRYLDCFSMFASMSIGFNHPKLTAIKGLLGRIAIQKPSNSDAYSEPMAEFVQTFGRYAMPDYLPHAFFIEGGALAVENALKTAFDWKVRKNLRKGQPTHKGSRIVHFRQAFHGRSGYSLSLTNTADPRKTKYFPIFDWPRIDNPKITFPLNERHLAEVIALEKKALAQIRKAVEEDADEIAGLIIEPIQGEGGDNHFRNEFFTALREICDTHAILFIMDEVQTGVGLTGKFWAHEHFDARPDIISFGKKTQVCGILASRRVDEVENNVFQQASRLNSTFGGNLIDMVRFSHILRIIDQEGLVDHARIRGEELRTGLEALSLEYPKAMSNARGRGLMCAFDLPDAAQRDQFRRDLLAAGLLVVGCGLKSLRFRPHLIISAEEVQLAIRIIRKVLQGWRGK
ncbi:MAG: L-lysine 6-transaminase [Desulfocapsaceae bacterium]|nr:L-lysine 6-transaminase [Desulfocapsaceae bacterium]